MNVQRAAVANALSQSRLARLPAEVTAALHAKPPTLATNASTNTTGRAEKPVISKKQFANKAEESNALSATH